MTINPADNTSSEPAFVQRWLSSGSKVSRFAVMGALGCLAGAIIGKLWLWLAGNRGPQRPAQAVCLLIDCSGSMLLGNAPGDFSGQKLMEVKSAASQFITRQDLAHDSIAVVGFGSSVHPAAKLGGNAAQLNLSVEGLSDGGSTAMHAALAAAASELAGAAEATRDPEAIRNILLFTDEYAALEAAKSCRARNNRIVAIGTGDADMGYLAQVSGGRVLQTGQDLSGLLESMMPAPGEPVISRQPAWDRASFWCLLLLLLALEWVYRRYRGLA